MPIEINHTPLRIHLHGFGGEATNQDPAGTAFRLMDKMWQVVRSKSIRNKGLNIWVYGPDRQVFAGVELEETPGAETGLEQKEILLLKYASCIHTGPYHLIRQTGQRMREELTSAGQDIILPYIEIYGHWDPDETKLETTLIMALK